MALDFKTLGRKALNSHSIFAMLFRFSTIGATATLTYFVVASTMMYFEVAAPEICSVFAYFVGIGISYLGQSEFTFRVRGHNTRQLVRYIVISLIGLTVSYGSVTGALYLGINPIWGAAFTSLLIPLVSFIAMRDWVFVNRAIGSEERSNPERRTEREGP